MQFHKFANMLLCSDVQHARDFYVTHLGLAVNSELDWFVGLQAKAGPGPSYQLALCAATHPSVPEAIRRPTAGLVLTFEVDDVYREHRRFEDSGQTILAPPVDEPWGQRHCFVQAPDGVALDLFQAIPPDPAWLQANGLV